MSVPELTGSLAGRAMQAVIDALGEAGIDAIADVGAFFPQPVGVLVAPPALTRRGLASATYSVPVRIVSGDPLNSLLAVDRLYSLADAVALAVSANVYSPSSFQGGANAEPLPAVELVATVTLTYQEVSPL